MLLKKNKLSRIGSTDKFIKASDLGCKRQIRENEKKRKETPQDSFLKEVVEHISIKEEN